MKRAKSQPKFRAIRLFEMIERVGFAALLLLKMGSRFGEKH